MTESPLRSLSLEQLRARLEELGRGLNALRLEGYKARDSTYARQYRRVRAIEKELARRGHPVVRHA